MAEGLPLAQYGATVTLNFAVAAAVGAAISALWIARGDSAWAAAVRIRLRTASVAALAVALGVHAAALWLNAAAMAEVPMAQAGAAAWSMLTATHLGMAWLAGTVALVASIATARFVRFQLLALAAFLYTRSMVSHAAGDGDFNAAMLADWIHLLAISAWVGAVFIAATLTLASVPAAKRDDSGDYKHAVQALSRTATWALGAIVATGVFSAWHHLGSASALTGSPYGATLLCKLALVALAVLMGAINRFLVMPALLAALPGDSAAVPARRFTRILRAEAVVLLGVLILAALLSSTPPPGAA